MNAQFMFFSIEYTPYSMKHIKEQANYAPNLQIEPYDLPDLTSPFPEFSIVPKRYIFPRQFNRRW